MSLCILNIPLKTKFKYMLSVPLNILWISWIFRHFLTFYGVWGVSSSLSLSLSLFFFLNHFSRFFTLLRFWLKCLSLLKSFLIPSNPAIIQALWELCVESAVQTFDFHYIWFYVQILLELPTPIDSIIAGTNFIFSLFHLHFTLLKA